jgi:hypothetical protein
MGTVTENKLDEFGAKGREIFLLFVRVFLILLTPSVYKQQGLLYLLLLLLVLRKVFLKNQKHQPNIVEITHLCIMHRVHTSYYYY